MSKRVAITFLSGLHFQKEGSQRLSNSILQLIVRAVFPLPSPHQLTLRASHTACPNLLNMVLRMIVIRSYLSYNNITRLVKLLTMLLLVLIKAKLQAQNVIVTQTLSLTSTCPGYKITVPFNVTGSYTGETTFIVQISDGKGSFNDITKGSRFNFGDSTKLSTSITAIIPNDLPPGRNYTVRVRAVNPDVIGTISTTKLIVKGKEAKPAPPLVDSVEQTCQRFTSTSMAELYAGIDITIVPGATPRLYYDSTFEQYSEEVTFYLCDQSGPDSVKCKTKGYFRVGKGFYSIPSYVYPVNEHTYYLSQIIDGCESDKVPSILRTLYRPRQGPAPANRFDPSKGDPNFGRLFYRQGEKAYPLNVNGHEPAPDHFMVAYNYGEYAKQTTVPPIPETSAPGKTRYSLGLMATDHTKACDLPISSTTYVVVVVCPATKPTISSNVITYYQGQTSSPLSATATETGASLVWYTQAIGGADLSIAPLPPTDKPGMFTYYVAQRVDECESERVAITVNVLPILGTEELALDNHIRVYPNPTAATLTVHLEGVSGTQPALLELMDMNGRMVLQQETRHETTVMQLNQHKSGPYMLRVKADNRTMVTRIVKF